MASIIQGFEYDIFISYRHNDNLDGWVTDFVQNLEKELKATIKEPLSIYFDKNPHDGLLETHNVDKSLKEKLKCLIFIPILSQTYCDSKSFAWQNEFCAFNIAAQDDRFGMEIVLSNRNVANRILPIRIHDLDSSDVRQLEMELGAKLRSIDFVFSGAGVNRPLLAGEDHPHDNKNKTYYRDQINKVAIAVKELIQGMKNPVLTPEKRDGDESPSDGPRLRNRFLRVTYIFLALVIGYFVYEKVVAFKRSSASETALATNSIAVLPFDNLSNDPEQEYFCDGTTEQIISSLAQLKDLKVIARTSVMQYKKNKKTITEIGKDLNVTHVLEGSVRKSGSQIRVTAQLIAVKDESRMWSEDFNNKVLADIFQIQDNVATRIAESLKHQLLPSEKEKLKSERPNNPEAYEHFLKGEFLHSYYLSQFREEDFANAEHELKMAIQLDSTYATAWASLANLYDSRTNFSALESTKNKYRKLSTEIAHKAFTINRKLPYTLLVEAQYWFRNSSSDAYTDSTFKYYKLAYEAAPNRGLICSEFAGFFASIGLYNNSLMLMERAKEIDPTRAYRYVNLGLVHFLLGDVNEAKKNAETAQVLEPNNVLATELPLLVNCKLKNFGVAKQFLEKLRTDSNRDFHAQEGWLLAMMGEKEKALKKSKSPEVYAALKMKRELLDTLERGARVPYLALKDTQYDFLRDDDRFKKIVEKKNNRYNEWLKKYGNIDLPKN